MATQSKSIENASYDLAFVPGYAGFVQEALLSWEEFQRDGQHITGDELHEWLNNWGAGTPPPKCHG